MSSTQANKLSPWAVHTSMSWFHMRPMLVNSMTLLHPATSCQLQYYVSSSGYIHDWNFSFARSGGGGGGTQGHLPVIIVQNKIYTHYCGTSIKDTVLRTH